MERRLSPTLPPRPEASLYPDTSIHPVQPIAVQDLIPGARSLDKLPLAEVPMPLFKVVRQDGASEYLGLIPYKLDGKDLLLFLNTIAPFRRDIDKEGVLDDWILPDERSMRSLHKRHQSMGDIWGNFERSRQTLMETIGYDPKLFRQKTAREFTYLVGMDSDEADRRFISSVFSDESPTELKNTFVDYLRNRYGLKHKKWLHEKSVDEVGLRLSKLDINKYSGRGPVIASFILKVLMGENQNLKTSVADICNSISNEGRVEIQGEDVGIHVRKLFKGKVEFTPSHKGNGVWFVPPETIDSTNYVVPVLHWTKDTNGERQWVTDFLDEPLLTHCREHLQEPSEGLELDSRRLNPLVGLGTIRFFLKNNKRNGPNIKILEKEKQYLWTEMSAEAISWAPPRCLF